jgi:hypothetical protein
MMVIFELDDFDYWTDNTIVKEEGVNAFSPLFVYLLYWAFCENKLSKNLMTESTFVNALTDMATGKIAFSNFVEKQLDGKLCDSYFDDSVRQFVNDYYEYDGYSKDLVKCFNLNLWELPNSLDRSADLNSLVNMSLKNYSSNLIDNPDIINFSSDYA